MKFLTGYKMKYIFLSILPILTAGVFTFPSYYIIAGDTSSKLYRRMGNISTILFVFTFIGISLESTMGDVAMIVNFIWALGTTIYMLVNYNKYISLILNNKKKIEKYKNFKEKNIRYTILTILPLISLGLLTSVSYYLVAQDTKEKKLNYIGHASILVIILNFIFINSTSILNSICISLFAVIMLVVPVVFISYRNVYKDILISRKELEEERIRKEKEYNDGWDNSKLNVKRENGAIREILINKICEDELILIDDLTYDVRLKIFEERELNGAYIGGEDLLKRNNLKNNKDIENFLEKLSYDI